MTLFDKRPQREKDAEMERTDYYNKLEAENEQLRKVFEELYHENRAKSLVLRSLIKTLKVIDTSQTGLTEPQKLRLITALEVEKKYFKSTDVLRAGIKQEPEL